MCMGRRVRRGRVSCSRTAGVAAGVISSLEYWVNQQGTLPIRAALLENHSPGADEVVSAYLSPNCCSRYCGQLCPATATSSLLHPISLSLLPIATSTATSNSDNVQQARIQCISVHSSCRHAHLYPRLWRLPIAGNFPRTHWTRHRHHHLTATTAGASTSTSLNLSHPSPRSMARGTLLLRR